MYSPINLFNLRINRYKSFVSLFFFIILFVSILITPQATLSEEGDDDDLAKKRQEIEQLEQELNRVRGEKQTLASTIDFLDHSIDLTQAQINQTEQELKILEQEIQQLTQRIGELDLTLEKLSHILILRVASTYKRSRISPLISLLTTDNLNHLMSLYKYLRNSQKNDRRMLYQLETIRTDFDQQKNVKEDKQLDLDQKKEKLQTQKLTLAKQQQDKQYLLVLTQNDEKKFQSELSQKLAELEAIQSIIAGRGDETKVGEVGEGDRIASVISGPSTCSSGGHLHFEVAKDGVHYDPASFLSSKEIVWDNAPDGSFNFSGTWNWPISDPIRITQGYGMTFYASTLRYYGGAPHTGIDMINNNYTVKAVKSGELYRGAIPCRGGSLRYVKVDHKDDDYSTYYLHVNY